MLTLLILLILLSLLTGASRAAETRDVVLWLSLDGLRSDYIERAETPRLDRLLRDAVYSLELEPVFPSLTFPSHVSQATGVKVERHGVPGNVFYDAARDRVYAYPSFGTLLEAEPIWLTAARQGVRVAAIDWPLSHGQRGAAVAAYFEPRFDPRRSDSERLEAVLDLWRNDRANEPLRLVMTYALGTDKAGHRFGPDSREVTDAMEELDALLGTFLDEAIKIFDQHRRGQEQLYVLLTTDHGMSPVHTLVHLGLLAEVEGLDGVQLNTGGNFGEIFFKADVPDRDAVIERAVGRAAAPAYARAFKRADLPEEWGLSHPTRVGDVVVVLERGYTFSRMRRTVTAPVSGIAPRGMHGYDPRDNPEMLGPAVFWRYPDPLAPRKLGRVHALQLHPTVASLLGIQPAEHARGKPLEIRSRP